MLCSVSDNPEPDLDELPELDDLEMDLVLHDIDPDWRHKFDEPWSAWDHYYQLNADEMDRLAIEAVKERKAAAAYDRERKLDEALEDIAMVPALLRRQAGGEP